MERLSAPKFSLDLAYIKGVKRIRYATFCTVDPYSELRTLSGPKHSGMRKPLTTADVDAVAAAPAWLSVHRPITYPSWLTVDQSQTLPTNLLPRNVGNDN